MQNSSDQAEFSIPTEAVREGPHLNPMGTFTVRRKAAKRNFPFDLKAGENIQPCCPAVEAEEPNKEEATP
jgi:hypothetical protein